MLHQCFEALSFVEFKSHYNEVQAVLEGLLFFFFLTAVCMFFNQEIIFEINISFTSEINIF